jgi:predicted dehydrogenase
VIRVGLVGCGFIGSAHAYAISRLAAAGLVDAELTAAFDDDFERAERLTKYNGGEPVSSVDALIQGVDVVWVCTWTSGHLPVVEAAADAGRAIFCEKPLAPTLHDAARVTSALERVPHQVGLVLRWSPVFARVAEIVSGGAYGRPLATTLRDDQYFPIQGIYRSTWRKDVAAAGGGTLIEHSIHDVDVLRWILGDPQTVAANTAQWFGHAGIDDIATVTCTYGDGSVSLLTSVWHQVMTRESSRRLEIFCERALLWTEDDYLGPLYVETADGTEVLEHEMPTWASELDVPAEFRAPVAHYGAPALAFLTALATKGADAVGHPRAAEALAAHRIVDRAYRSAEAGGAPELLTAAD